MIIYSTDKCVQDKCVWAKLGKWELEDYATTPERRTKEILAKTMEGVEDYLTFTMESGEDFEGGWLPTLDTALKVGNNNQIQFRFYEKETTSKRTVQKRTAMEHNSKIQVVSNDLVRRLCNTIEELGSQETIKVIDDYSQKLLNSGYSVEETRAIVVKGLKGYEGRKNRCREEGRSLWRTANQSRGARHLKKLTANTSWYRGRKKRNYYGGGSTKKGEQQKGAKDTRAWEQKSVLFVEQTREGELGKQLRDVVQRLAPVMGFAIKIVERTGSNLKSKFPQASLWEGAMCGRDKCVTCGQGAEVIPPCTRKSLVYENVCAVCNEGAGGKDEVVGSNPDVPSIYVGETSRTLFERTIEHWGAARGNKAARAKSHIAKHQELTHPDREPEFVMRAVKFHRTALSRQTGEAVRIRRRGGEGAVLNSRGEFNRSFIPRLQLVEEEVSKEMEQAEEEMLRITMEELEKEAGAWVNKKNKERAAPSKRFSNSKGSSKPSKRVAGSRESRPLKRMKFDLIPRGWGSLTREETEAKTTCMKTKGVGGEDGEYDDDDRGGSPPSTKEVVGVGCNAVHQPEPTLGQVTPLITTIGGMAVPCVRGDPLGETSYQDDEEGLSPTASIDGMEETVLL